MLGFLFCKIHPDDSENKNRLKELLDGLKLDVDADVRAEARAAEAKVAARTPKDVQKQEEQEVHQHKAEEALG